MTLGKCRLLQCDVTLTPARITNNAVTEVFCAGSHVVPRILHSLATKKVKKVEKSQTFPTMHTLRSLPEEGKDVCKVWFRLVQKCGFV
jgi:hypothetical protein